VLYENPRDPERPRPEIPPCLKLIVHLRGVVDESVIQPAQLLDRLRLDQQAKSRQVAHQTRPTAVTHTPPILRRCSARPRWAGEPDVQRLAPVHLPFQDGEPVLGHRHGIIVQQADVASAALQSTVNGSGESLTAFVYNEVSLDVQDPRRLRRPQYRLRRLLRVQRRHQYPHRAPPDIASRR